LICTNLFLLTMTTPDRYVVVDATALPAELDELIQKAAVTSQPLFVDRIDKALLECSSVEELYLSLAGCSIDPLMGIPRIPW